MADWPWRFFRTQANIARARSRVLGLILQTRNFPCRSAVISSAFTSSLTWCEIVGEPILSDRSERTTSARWQPQPTSSLASSFVIG